MKKIRLLIFTILVFLISVSGVWARTFERSCIYVYEPINRENDVRQILEKSLELEDYLISIAASVEAYRQTGKAGDISDPNYRKILDLNGRITQKISEINELLNKVSTAITNSNANYINKREEYKIILNIDGDVSNIYNIQYQYSDDYITEVKLDKFPTINFEEVKIDNNSKLGIYVSNPFTKITDFIKSVKPADISMEEFENIYNIVNGHTESDIDPKTNHPFDQWLSGSDEYKNAKISKLAFSYLTLSYNGEVSESENYYDLFVKLIKAYQRNTSVGRMSDSVTFTAQGIEKPDYNINDRTCPTYVIIDPQTKAWSLGNQNSFTLVLAEESDILDNNNNSACYNYKKESSCKMSESNGVACVWVKNESAPNGGFCNVDNLLYVSCGDARDIPYQIPGIISMIVNLLKIATPIILIFVSIITLLKALAASKEDEIKKAQSSLIKKIIAAAMVFFIVSIVQFVVSKVASASEKVGFSDCLSCFLNNSCEDSTYYKTVVQGIDYCTPLTTGKTKKCPTK